MSKVLAEYPSSSNPGKKYQIIRPNAPSKPIYCTCYQWKLKRTCKHLERWAHEECEASEASMPLTSPLEDIIKKEVERLSNGRAR